MTEEEKEFEKCRNALSEIADKLYEQRDEMSGILRLHEFLKSGCTATEVKAWLANNPPEFEAGMRRALGEIMGLVFS